DPSVADGAPNSLRDVIDQANATSDTNIIINLAIGATYTLTIANTDGQENANEEGDLDIKDTSGVAAAKTYTIVGLGGVQAAVVQTVTDRVFHVIGSDVVVNFRDMIITGGKAVDDGTDGAQPGDTDALGGAVLNGGALPASP